MRAATGLGQYVPVASPVHALDRARPRWALVAALTVGAVPRARASPASGVLAALVAVAVCAVARPVARRRCAASGRSRILLAFTLLVHALTLAPRDRALCACRAARRRRRRAAHGPLLRGAHRAARRRHVAADAHHDARSSSPTRSSGSCARCGASACPAGDVAMMLTIALRFIPTTAEEAERIVTAQQARGARFDEGGPVTRARARTCPCSCRCSSTCSVAPTSWRPRWRRAATVAATGARGCASARMRPRGLGGARRGRSALIAGDRDAGLGGGMADTTTVLTVSYDGARFAGFARQAGPPTVQGAPRGGARHRAAPRPSRRRAPAGRTPACTRSGRS